MTEEELIQLLKAICSKITCGGEDTLGVLRSWMTAMIKMATSDAPMLQSEHSHTDHIMTNGLPSQPDKPTGMTTCPDLFS